MTGANISMTENEELLKFRELVGARAYAVMYTLLESARANNLDVYEYLNYLLEQVPESDLCNNPEIIDNYLPWSEKLPEKCRLIQKRKKSLK